MEDGVRGRYLWFGGGGVRKKSIILIKERIWIEWEFDSVGMGVWVYV